MRPIPMSWGAPAALLLLASAVLSGCGDGGDGPDASTTAVPKVAAQRNPAAMIPTGHGIGTPNKDRVATIGLLNKRNNLTQDLVLKTGESRRVGNIVVKVESCERTLPWETPKEIGAFVQVFVHERPAPRADLQWRTLFSGWLFKNSPSLNVVEHPIYDVWVKDCAMKFPGEEEKPAAAASDKSAPKASGNDSGGDSPAPTPAPTPVVAPPAPPAAPAPLAE